MTIGPRRWNSYFVCGCAGYLVGLAIAMWLADQAGLGVGARLAIALVPLAAFLTAAALSTAIAGYQRIVFYEKAVVAIGLGVVGAHAAGAPWLVALDAATLGVGGFLACGRLGCLRVACCHGRPARWGIRYGADHVDAGLDPRFSGIPLLPVQLADAIAAAVLTVTGCVIARHAVPGAAAAVWTAGYGLARFALESVRGDDRPHALGVSEAQYFAAATTWVALALWPAPPIAAAAIALTAAIVALAIARRAGRPVAYWLARPRHLREIDAILAEPRAERVRTTEGLDVSIHSLPEGALDLVLSHARRSLAARDLGPLVARLGACWRVLEVVDGRTTGLVHIVIRRARETR
jgi:hypothetical protein